MDSSAPGDAGRPSPSPFPPVAGALDRALAVVEYLREHDPWDAKQTAESLIPHLLEESQETVEAIRSGDPDSIADELGDLLLNVAFQIVVAEESGRFTRDEVVRRLEAKMIRRHPAIFGGSAGSWEEIKAGERKRAKGVGGSNLDGLPVDLDPLLRAHRIQERVAGVGFDWEEAAGALAKVKEEVAEVEEAALEEKAPGAAGAPEGGTSHLREELGDLLFAVVNFARLSGLHARSSLEGANAKFERRFREVERLARDRGVLLPGAALAELDALWDEVKRSEAPRP